MTVTYLSPLDEASLAAGTDPGAHVDPGSTSPTALALAAEPDQLAALAPPALGAARWLTGAARAGRFALHFLEMVVVMMVGMAPYHSLLRALPPESAAWIARGTYAYSLGMALSMALPMLPWMKLRGHGWRSGTEMALAMSLPTVVVVLLCALGLDQAQPWIRNADGPLMLLAMLGLMLYRRDHYTGAHAAHA